MEIMELKMQIKNWNLCVYLAQLIIYIHQELIVLKIELIFLNLISFMMKKQIKKIKKIINLIIKQ